MNFIFSALGLIGWIFGAFKFEKNKYDAKKEPFPFKQYFIENWDDWLWAAFWSIVLLVIGHYGLGMEFVKQFDEKLEWSDLYYLASGPASLAASKFIELIKKKTE